MSIAILDYGMANLRSVQKAFEAAGHPARIIRNADEVRACDRLVLPGVGAVADAIVTIRARTLDGPIIEHIRSGRPFLGICLGLQMLMSWCYEGGKHAGLGVVPGDCVRLDVDQQGLKVPHMGWNRLSVAGGHPVLGDLPGAPYVYFVHSYHVLPADPGWTIATADYGRPIVAAIGKDNLLATQFHPEKSQKVGLEIVRRFARM